MISPIQSDLVGNLHYLKIYDKNNNLLLQQLVGSNWSCDMNILKTAFPIKYSHWENGDEIWKEIVL